MVDEYHLYIDDSGVRYPDATALDRLDGMNYFALGGILIKESDKAAVKEKFFIFCTKWKINYPLHSAEIRGSKGNFSWLSNLAIRKQFMEELETFLISIPVVGFAAVIDRVGYNKRYKGKYGADRWMLCKTTYSILIERAVKYVDSLSGKLRIKFEMCSKEFDRAILTYTKALKNTGHPFSLESSEAYSALNPDDYRRIVLGDPKQKKKTSIFTQIADLYLYPMVKRRYSPDFRPWHAFFINKRVIDALIPEKDWQNLGIKYSCFEHLNNKKPE